MIDDYDTTREWENLDEQSRYDEAQDNASRERAEAYDREHSEDVP